MVKHYPPIKPNTFPSRQHFNVVSSLAQDYGAMFDRNGNPNNIGLSPWAQVVLQITNTKVNDEDTDTSGKYLGKMIYYFHKDEEWKDDNVKEWEIDGAGTTFPIMGEDERVTCFWDIQRGFFVPVAPQFLQGICLNENHPGQGILFDVHIGTRNKSSDGWDYYETPLFKCIDWRFGVPYPDAGATGLAEWRWSDSVGYPGKILEVVALDCDTAGPCFP